MYVILDQAQTFSDPLENFESAPKNVQNSNVRAPAGTRVCGIRDGGSATGTAPTETQLNKISGLGRAVRMSDAAFCQKTSSPAPANSHTGPPSGPRRKAREWNMRREIGPGDRRRVRIAQKKSRTPGAGCVEMEEFWCQLYPTR